LADTLVSSDSFSNCLLKRGGVRVEFGSCRSERVWNAYSGVGDDVLNSLAGSLKGGDLNQATNRRLGVIQDVVCDLVDGPLKCGKLLAIEIRNCT
jgi:hypothetical protein